VPPAHQVTRFTAGGQEYTLHQALLRQPTRLSTLATLLALGVVVFLVPGRVLAGLLGVVVVGLPLGSLLSRTVADHLSALLVPRVMQQVG
jgi:hypothetical protein